MVAQSPTEAEYRVMAQTTCEIIWMRLFLKEIEFSVQLWRLKPGIKEETGSQFVGPAFLEAEVTGL